MLQRLKERCLIALIAFAHWLARSTWKLKRAPLPAAIQQRIDSGLPCIFGHLHQDDISLSAFYAGTRVGVLVSHSKDGNLLAGFFRKIGFVPARGSSSRGAASGFLELLRLSRDEKLCYITFAVDGPRGPVGHAKHGIFKLAQLLDAPVIPTVALAPARWTFRKSWSKHFIAKPFSELEIRYLEPLSAEWVSACVDAKKYDELASVFDARIAAGKVAGYF